MILWMGALGALIGWCFADFDGFSFTVGGLFGLVAGWIARKGVRAEVADATAALQAQIDMLLAREVAPPLPRAVAEPAIDARDVTRRAPPEPPAQQTARPDPFATSVRTAAIDRPERPPLAPAEPGMIATMMQAALAGVKAWLLGGNTIVRIGLVILFVGLSFLASYAASAGLFPVELRLALVVVIGIALLFFGFRSRTLRPGFGLALQGAGVATIYLTLFAAAKLYDTFPTVAAFALMIVVCALGCALALLQRSQALAVTAFAGGFAVPLLLAGGGGGIVGVFVYYTILNLAVLFIARRQSWRVLNLIGFFATFGAAALWGMISYQPADFVAAQVFLILSVLIYIATAILYTRATPGRLGNVVDTTLLFGPALAGFGLQVGLVHDKPFGSAFAALGFAALYLGVAAWTVRHRRESFRVMNEAMLAIGIGFVTLAVPLALGARWTSAAWALEGAGAFWVGMRQSRWMPRLFGILLQLLAALLFLGGIQDNVSAIPLANPGFVGAILVALAAFATAYWLRAPLSHSGSRLARSYAILEARLGAPAFLFGFGFWWLAWVVEAGRSVPPRYAGLSPVPTHDAGIQQLTAMLAYVVSAWGAQAIGRRLRWPVAVWPSHATLVALALAFLGMIGAGRHLLYLPDLVIWIAAIALHLRALYLNDVNTKTGLRHGMVRASHVGGVWLGAAFLADCLWLGIDRANLWATAWAEVTFLVATVAILLGLTASAGRAMRSPTAGSRWPLDRHAADYGWFAAAPVAMLVFFGAFLTATLSAGDAFPLPYVPLLNPVDLALGLSLAVLELWRRTIVASAAAPPGAVVLRGRGTLATLAGLAFVIVNMMWLRLSHHLLGVAWDGDALLASFIVQTGLAILWTVLALALMVVAHRRGQRAPWLVGAALLGLTVVKLLLVDLNNAGGGARIVAFIVVGLLMLAVGYLAPLPPKLATAPDGEGLKA